MSQSTYLYKYSYVIYGQTPGGFHGSELFFLFKLPIKTDSVTDSVSDNILDLWTRFGKDGRFERRDG